jgi:hypothetical protein
MGRNPERPVVRNADDSGCSFGHREDTAAAASPVARGRPQPAVGAATSRAQPWAELSAAPSQREACEIMRGVASVESETILVTDDDLLRRAQQVLPGVAQTYSKAPDQHVAGVYPVFLESGDGCRVRDSAGREWIDYPCALGPMILGYNDPEVNAAVHRRVDLGPTFSLASRLEVEVAELVVDMVPCAESVRFLKTGSEATTAAVRLARAATGRDHVAMCGYHGWHD